MSKPYETNNIQISSDGFQKLTGTKDGKNFLWTTEINTELPIRIGTSGYANTIAPTIIPKVFRDVTKRRGDMPAQWVQRGGKNLCWTWKQYYTACVQFAQGLHKLGVNQRKAVNIMGWNSPEWAIAYFGGIFHNNVVSGVYTTNGPEACLYQAENSEAEVIVVDTLPQLK